MQKLLDSLTLQKREIQENIKKTYIKRELRLLDLDKPIIKVIIGPRRAGKSFFAMHEVSRRSSFGYINFDDEVLYGIEDYNVLLEATKRVYNDPKVLLLDEVQNLRKWELFVNRLQRQNYNLVLTGSNSKLLSRELSAHLTGRYLVYVIFPFSFREYLRAFRKEFIEAEKRAHFVEYVLRGGFPEPLVMKLEYKNYLTNLYDSLLFKDIMLRYRLRSTKDLQDLASFLIANIGNLVSYNNLTRFTRIKSVHTIIKYLGFLEEAFLFFSVSAFSPKVKEQIKSPKKIYVIDNGFYCAKSFALSPNMGKLLENLVAIELKKRALRGELEFFYYKNPQNYEVDFVIKKGADIKQLIQVCYDLRDEKAKKREVRALLHASNEIGCDDLLILTENYENEEKVEWFGLKGNIRFVPLWKWLFNTVELRPDYKQE